ncbi:MAG TPA: DNA-binding protein HU [Deltaproteobacteria bacterium]|nr:MAG: DNA-binding protein HU [Deltaproteobacteria bacterium GWA2_45_12]HBF12988.1 DNA-binding protein HU [Deltaproteobacteria bacterium]
MTKAELINQIAKDCGCAKALAENALNSATNAVAKCLKKGDKITLTGFGTFSIAKRKARIGRNPQTGAEIKIKASRVPKFKAGQALKNLVA